jgi:hypothetical protein
LKREAFPGGSEGSAEAKLKKKKQTRRIVWLVLDAAGYEITGRCIRAGVCPSLAAVRQEGYLGSSRPPEPNCETPPALRALFSGSEPPESGIWGFRMPDYERKLQRAVSGFAVAASGAPAIWDELERAGGRYTLINAAFRKDAVWEGDYEGFDLLLDGYRNHRAGFRSLRLNEGGGKVKLGRTVLRVEAKADRLLLRRRWRSPAALTPGRVQTLRLSAKSCALGYTAGNLLFLSTSSRPHVRLSEDQRRSSASLVPRFIHHGSLFGFSRREGGLSVDEEMSLSEHATGQIGELALTSVRELRSTLTVVYFSLIDELAHVYLDQIEGLWPDGRACELLRRCYALLDSYVGRIMDCLEPGALLVLSADHGQAPYRRVLHLNELLAEAGLVRRTGRGYDLGRSVAYYHPANCGQVVVNPARARRAGLSRQRIGERVLRCLEQANDSLGAGISHLWGGQGDPYLLFLYPASDTHISGRYNREARPIDEGHKGGQHLSPLCPTPWIQAMLGLWAPGGLPFGKEGIPQRNSAVKPFLLRYLLEP